MPLYAPARVTVMCHVCAALRGDACRLSHFWDHIPTHRSARQRARFGWWRSGIGYKYLRFAGVCTIRKAVHVHVHVGTNPCGSPMWTTRCLPSVSIWAFFPCDSAERRGRMRRMSE